MRLVSPCHPVLDHGDVDVHDVAVLEDLVARNAVADLVIDRGTDRFRVGAMARRRIVERRRHRALDVHHVLVAELVEMRRGNARLHVGGDEVEHLRSEPSGGSHQIDFLGCAALNAHGFLVTFHGAIIASGGVRLRGRKSALAANTDAPEMIESAGISRL
jgi:hypothetical protein